MSAGHLEIKNHLKLQQSTSQHTKDLSFLFIASVYLLAGTQVAIFFISIKTKPMVKELAIDARLTLKKT